MSQQGQRFWCKDVMTVTTHACKLGSMTPSNFANFSNTDHLDLLKSSPMDFLKDLLYLLIPLNTFWYLWIPFDTFEYFWIPFDTFEYLLVPLNTFWWLWHFWKNLHLPFSTFWYTCYLSTFSNLFRIQVDFFPGTFCGPLSLS